MKKVIFLLLVFAGFMACENEIIEELPQEVSKTEGISAKKGQKVDVCHNGNIINVSVNALNAHQEHGDAVDMDGDGYFDLENDCGVPVDCDDEDADLNEICDACTEYEWAGVLNSIDVSCWTYNSRPSQTVLVSKCSIPGSKINSIQVDIRGNWRVLYNGIRTIGNDPGSLQCLLDFIADNGIPPRF